MARQIGYLNAQQFTAVQRVPNTNVGTGAGDEDAAVIFGKDKIFDWAKMATGTQFRDDGFCSCIGVPGWKINVRLIGTHVKTSQLPIVVDGWDGGDRAQHLGFAHGAKLDPQPSDHTRTGTNDDTFFWQRDGNDSLRKFFFRRFDEIRNFGTAGMKARYI